MKNTPVKHEIGDKVLVTITSLAPYGAFADLEDGGSGLIHISEIADRYIRNIADFLPCGSIHEALVIGKGEKPYTYSLSIKRLNRRPRQKKVLRVKPLTRKEANKEELDAISFAPMKEALPEFIAKEYKRLNEKN